MGYLVAILSRGRAPQVVILSGAPPGAESKDPVWRQQKAPPSSTPRTRDRPPGSATEKHRPHPAVGGGGGGGGGVWVVGGGGGGEGRGGGGLVAEVENAEDYWRDDLVSFVIGCSFSFESELIEAGIEIRHNTMGCYVPMYLTGVPCTPAGSMSGNGVMSMRPIPYDQVVKAVQISGAIPKVHGAPIHIGDPAAIGVRDIMHPEFGDPVEIRDGEVPVFWACGVTPQSIVMNSKPPFAITHAAGCMLITDTKNINLKD